MRVFATRPEQQNSAWITQLERKGFEAVALPLLEIKSLGAQYAASIKRRVFDLDHYHIIIFVSQNAVRFGMDWVDDLWPQLPIDVSWVAIGEKTASSLNCRLSGLAEAQSSLAMTSESLLELDLMQRVKDKKILIFRGLGGRTVLAKELSKRGALVDYCETYQRLLPLSSIGLLVDAKLSSGDAVPVFSGEALANFHEIASEAGVLNWSEVKLFVPGERVRNSALALGFKHVVTALNAGESAMLKAICTYY